MKKTCEGCKALDVHGCNLNYKTQEEFRKVIGSTFKYYKPAEECPKPKTVKEYVSLALNSNKPN